MQITKVEKHIDLIDVETAGLRNFIASYILKGKKVAIIETGPTSSTPNLLLGLRELDVKPEVVAYVAVSHIHLDHSGGAGSLLKHLPKAKIIVHPRGVPHLVNPEKLWEQSKEALGNIAETYGKPEPVPEERIIAAKDGLMFDVGNNVKLRVLETLGHASHHLSYYELLNGGVFPGDAAGIYLSEFNVCVPTTPSPFRLDIALASLGKLISLKPKALYYSHFGKAQGAMDRLQAYVEQLKLWANGTKHGIENREGLEAIRHRIFESDKAFQKAVAYIKEHVVLNETVLKQSVQGFIDFVQEFGEIKT